MIRKVVSVCMLICVMGFHSYALSFILLPSAEGVSLRQRKVGNWADAAQRIEINHGDSIKVADGAQATIMIEEKSKVLIKGACSLVLLGENRNMNLEFSNGQLLLKRVEPHTLDTIVITMGECKVIPTGTVAAMKYTKNG